MRLVYGPRTETTLVKTTDRVDRLELRPLTLDVVEEIKVFPDLKNVLAGPGRFKWEISDDLWVARLDIVQVKIFVTTTGGGCTCSLTNLGSASDPKAWEVLDPPLTIGAGAYSAKTDRFSLEGIDETKNTLDEDDRLWLNVDSAGGKGLGLIVTYGRDRRP